MKSFLAIIIILSASVSVKAQSETRSEKLSTQLKNGTAPGLLFNRNAPQDRSLQVNTAEGKESLIAQIRKGIAAGMKFLPVPAATSNVNRSATISPSATVPLASEMEIKKEAIKTIAKPPVASNQEEVKKEAQEGKQ